MTSTIIGLPQAEIQFRRHVLAMKATRPYSRQVAGDGIMNQAMVAAVDLWEEHELLMEQLALCLRPSASHVLQLQLLHRVLHKTIFADELVTLSLSWVHQILLNLSQPQTV